MGLSLVPASSLKVAAHHVRWTTLATFQRATFSAAMEGFRQFQKVSSIIRTLHTPHTHHTRRSYHFTAHQTSDGPAAGPDEEEPYTPRTPPTATSFIAAVAVVGKRVAGRLDGDQRGEEGWTTARVGSGQGRAGRAGEGGATARRQPDEYEVTI